MLFGRHVKPEAWDRVALTELIGRGWIHAEPPTGEECVIHPGASWLALEPGALTFARLRLDGCFALVVESDAEADRFVLFPLATNETPLDAIADPRRRRDLERVRAAWARDPAPLQSTMIELSAREVVAKALLGRPVPEPRRILAVAANFASHLVHDLDVSQDVIEAFRRTPPRVFQKHPPLHAPGSDPRPDAPFRGLIGPHDRVRFPSVVSLPHDERGVTHVVPTRLDYEAELGMVLARRLTSPEARSLSDEELWRCIAGYVLISDVKARNPQVFERILARHHPPTEPEERYLTGDADVDGIIGRWDEETCAWWGYAASQGDYTALGPFFVASAGEPHLPARTLVCARSYSAERGRALRPPRGLRADTLYLRQCARVSQSPSTGEPLLWGPPDVLRAILAPSCALDPGSGERALERGDIVALGTPGGIALTVSRGRLIRWLNSLLFWWDARAWHDTFFKDSAKYLHQGDRLFLWASGLGYQHLEIRRIELPELPETIEDEQLVKASREAQAAMDRRSAARG